MNFIRPEELVSGAILPVRNSQNEDLYQKVDNGVNWYRIVTDFYLNAMWGQLPRTDADRALFDAFEQSTVARSIDGYGAVVRLPSAIFAPSGRYIWRWEEAGIHRGWIIGWPFKSQREVGHADRIRLFIKQLDRPLMVVLDFELTGGTLGTRLAMMITAGEVGVWGDGINDYDQMKQPVAWFNTRLSRNAVLLDRHAAPHLQGPVEARNAQAELPLSADGSFLPLAGDTPKFEYLTWDSPEALNQFHLNTLIDMLHVVTGVPATAFGLGSSSGDSGVARERQLFAALSKVRRWRRDVETALAEFAVAEIQWVDDPFIGWQESVQAELALLGAGVTSVEEVRQRLNIG